MRFWIENVLPALIASSQVSATRREDNEAERYDPHEAIERCASDEHHPEESQVEHAVVGLKHVAEQHSEEQQRHQVHHSHLEDVLLRRCRDRDRKGDFSHDR
jgi:hypothetical protein